VGTTGPPLFIHGPHRGLELLARHLGLFEIDNSQQGAAAGAGIVKELTDFEASRRIAFMLCRPTARQDTNAPPIGQPGEPNDAHRN
jgi:hypothetical protein